MADFVSKVLLECPDIVLLVEFNEVSWDLGQRSTPGFCGSDFFGVSC